MIGGTGRTRMTTHSGRFVLFSMPMKIRSSDGMPSNHSRMSRAFNLCSLLSSFFSLKVVGFSRIILPCSASQCMQTLRLAEQQTFSTSLIAFLNSGEPGPCFWMISSTRARW